MSNQAARPTPAAMGMPVILGAAAWEVAEDAAEDAAEAAEEATEEAAEAALSVADEASEAREPLMLLLVSEIS
jgi:6,7-dimethyl-8-ribityllumazine synthase